MRKIISIIVFVITIILVAIPSVATDSEYSNKAINLTLQRAINYAIKNSEDIQIEKLKLKKAEKQHEEYWEYLKKGTNEEVEEYHYALDIPPVHKNVGLNKRYKSKGIKKKYIDLDLQIAKWNIELLENRIKYDVEKEFYILLKEKANMDLEKENLEIIKYEYNQSKKMFQLNKISKKQLLALETELYNAELNFKNYEMTYKLKLMDFNELIGLPKLQEIKLVYNLKYKPYVYIHVKSTVEKSHKKSLMLKLAEERRELAEMTLETLEKWYLPRANVYRERKVELADKRLEYKKAENNLENVKKNLESSIIKSVISILNIEKNIEIYENIVTNSEAKYELAKKEFELGKITQNEVNQTRLELMNSKRNLLNLIYSHKIAYVDYKYDKGIGKDLLR